MTTYRISVNYHLTSELVWNNGLCSFTTMQKVGVTSTMDSTLNRHVAYFPLSSLCFQAYRLTCRERMLSGLCLLQVKLQRRNWVDPQTGYMQSEMERVVLSPPELGWVPHYGYNSLFPMLMDILPLVRHLQANFYWNVRGAFSQFQHLCCRSRGSLRISWSFYEMSLICGPPSDFVHLPQQGTALSSHHCILCYLIYSS